MPDSEHNVADRLRVAAFRAIARRETGLSIGASEAESWLSRFPISLGDALDAFGEDNARVNAVSAITPIRGSDRTRPEMEQSRLRHERSPIGSAAEPRPIDVRRKYALDRASVSFIWVAVL